MSLIFDFSQLKIKTSLFLKNMSIKNIDRILYIHARLQFNAMFDQKNKFFSIGSTT
jgi:hypothetical protein